MDDTWPIVIDKELERVLEAAGGRQLERVHRDVDEVVFVFAGGVRVLVGSRQDELAFEVTRP